ncbi:MAG: nucleotide disphospho-sugar-binding domain-containing protein [Bacteroidota bacterium]
MAHILCITSGLTGILHASFEMVARMEAAGYRVTYASPREVGAKVKAQGFDYVQLHPLVSPLAPELAPISGPFRKWKRWWTKFQQAPQRRQAGIAALHMEAFIQQVRQLKVDLLIIDVELHEHIMTAYTQKMPLLLLSQWFSLWKQPGLPPLVRDTLPGKGWAGTPFAIEWDWWRIKRQRWWMFQKQKWRSVATDRRSILLAYARQVGFPLAYLRDNYWPGPFTYSRLPVISITAEELEFPHDKRSNLYYVGPMVYAQRKSEKSDDVVQRQLTAIFLQCQKEQKALIYCSVSTFKQGDTTFLKKLIKAVTDQPKWILVLGMGGLLNRAMLGDIPNNVHPFSWVPQLEILAHTDCSINHGGIHTINECIHFQVPMLIYSGKRSDQNGCAARVAYHGLGIMADKDQDDVSNIRQKITQILSHPSFRERMHAMHRIYQAYQKDGRFLQLLARFLPSSS